MRVEELEPLKEMALAAHAFWMRHDMLYHNRDWYLRERDGVIPEPFAQELAEAEARVMAAARALVESAEAVRE